MTSSHGFRRIASAWNLARLEGRSALRTIQDLYGEKVEGADGLLGRIKDLYLEPRRWIIRYMVLETGSWLTSRQILLSPFGLGTAYRVGRGMTSNLTRSQVEASPALEWHKPISRRFEEEYNRHFGWPSYWKGGADWGITRLPLKPLPGLEFSGSDSLGADPERDGADVHLHRAQTLSGYYVRARDGILGQLCDFIMDSESWAIRQLVVRIGDRHAGPEVRIPAAQVSRIHPQDSTLFLSGSRLDVERSSGPVMRAPLFFPSGRVAR